uniref:Macro domain-containing protein n=1 Tax=Neogobius melanostomus TaxID=47308 RepID=A0A8C6SGL7_9GOBI
MRWRAEIPHSTSQSMKPRCLVPLFPKQVFLCLGDITKQEADAIVNSANEDLKHSRGVASALSEAGGPEVQKESSILVKNNGKVSTGDVVVTSGGQLRCKKLLHAVGPANGKAGGRESAIIQKVITSALNLCEIMEFRSIALPCISSGLFGVPIDVCAEAIVRAVQVFGAVGGRTLTKIKLIDKRSEVVESLRAQYGEKMPGDSVLVEGLTGAPFSAVFFVDLLPWDNDCDGTPIEVNDLKRHI